MMEWLVNLFTRKKIAKIVSVLAALMLWFFVMNDQNPMMDRTVSVPLTVLNAPSDAKVTESDDSVHIKLRGQRSAFAAMSSDDLKAVVTLENAEEGKNAMRVHAVVPQGLEVESVSPETITFTIDPFITSDKSVSLIRAGGAPQGMAVSSVTAEQSYVEISGPRTAVNSVAQVIGYVGITPQNTQDFDLNVPLTAVNDEGRSVDEVTVAPKAVNVHVEMVRGLSRKVVNIKPVFEGSVDKDYVVTNVTVDPVRLEIAGDAQQIEKITSINTEPIDITGLKKSTRKAVSLVLPDGTTVTNKMVFINIDVNKK